jgi:hypothetical protein
MLRGVSRNVGIVGELGKVGLDAKPGDKSGNVGIVGAPDTGKVRGESGNVGMAGESGKAGIDGESGNIGLVGEFGKAGILVKPGEESGMVGRVAEPIKSLKDSGNGSIADKSAPIGNSEGKPCISRKSGEVATIDKSGKGGISTESGNAGQVGEFERRGQSESGSTGKPSGSLSAANDTIVGGTLVFVVSRITVAGRFNSVMFLR